MDFGRDRAGVVSRAQLIRLGRTDNDIRRMVRRRDLTRVHDGGLVVELDGRLFHDSAGQRHRDFERDLDAAVDGRDSIRLSWGQVFYRSCSTAAKIAVLLRRRGWSGRPRPCGPGCAVSR